MTPDISALFAAPDGENEPTIWRRTDREPIALLRRCDACEAYDVLAGLLSGHGSAPDLTSRLAWHGGGVR